MIDNMRFSDAAWKIFERFAEYAPTDPALCIIFGPPRNVWNTTICPLASLIPATVVEASSIRSHYAALDVTHHVSPFPEALCMQFRNLQHFLIIPMLERFSTTKLTLSKLFQRIHNPDDPNYPVITSLPSGSYVCTVTYHLSTDGLFITVFKP